MSNNEKVLNPIEIQELETQLEEMSEKLKKLKEDI